MNIKIIKPFEFETVYYKMLMRTAFALLFIGFTLTTFSQNSKISDTTKFKFQIDYLNNYVYNGRSDSMMNPYITPSVNLHFGNGLYSSFSANYLMAKDENRFDFFELDLGKEYTIGKKTSGEIYGTKYFYSNNANVLNGDISADIGGTLNQDLGIFEINNTADLFFSSGTDIQYELGISKLIEVESENGTWSFTPSFNLIGSTLNYYESFTNRKLNRGTKSKAQVLPTISSSTTVQDKGFKVMASELSIPLSYENKKWGFELTTTYALPFNPVKTHSIIKNTLANGTSTNNTIDSTPYSERNLKNVFYFQTGIFLKF